MLDHMPEDFQSNEIENDEEINGRHLNPTDFSLASDLPQLDPIAEEGEDPIEFVWNPAQAGNATHLDIGNEVLSRGPGRNQ